MNDYVFRFLRGFYEAGLEGAQSRIKRVNYQISQAETDLRYCFFDDEAAEIESGLKKSREKLAELMVKKASLSGKLDSLNFSRKKDLLIMQLKT